MKLMTDLMPSVRYTRFVYQDIAMINRWLLVRGGLMTPLRVHPMTRGEALNRFVHAEFPWHEPVGRLYVYARSYPENTLPTMASRQAMFKEFRDNVADFRSYGLLPRTPIRYIDRTDLSLNLTTVHRLLPEDAVALYQRQMRYLAMFTTEPNPFETLRRLIGTASHYSRPEGHEADVVGSYTGDFVHFLQDYYFAQYYPTLREWNLYVDQQQAGLTEIENEVFKFLNDPVPLSLLDDEGKVIVTTFSRTGLELLANLLRPKRTLVPPLAIYEQAFTRQMWRDYFPYSWAQANRRVAMNTVRHWIDQLQPKQF